MPTDQYLTEEQEVVFGRFVGEPSQAELEQFFYLDAADLERIAGRRGDHNRLGFALQVGTVRFLGAFLFRGPWWNIWRHSSESMIPR